jgi:hypothetical protein
MPTRLFTLFAVLLLATTAHAALPQNWDKAFPISGVAEFHMDSNDASFRVSSTDRNQIEVHVAVTGWGVGVPDGVGVEDHQTGNRVDLKVRVPHAGFTFGNKHVEVVVYVPRETNLDLHTGDGAIRVDRIKGSQRLETGDGSIESSGVDGAFEAISGDGHIRVDGRFDSLRIRTGDGHVQAEALAGSRLASNWSIRTSDGRVSLSLPSNLAADLDASTGDGRLVVDIPVTVTGKTGDRSLRGKLNGGGPVIEVHTGDGSVHIGQS